MCIRDRCKCKPHVGGLKCDREVEGGYYLPSIGQYIFSADDIVPHAPHEVFGDFDGAVVNGSFASRRVSFNVTESAQMFYIMIYYSLINDGRTSPRIDMEFSKDGKFTMFKIIRIVLLTIKNIWYPYLYSSRVLFSV